MQAGTDDAVRDFSRTLDQVNEVMATPDDEIKETERRLLEVAQAQDGSAGAAAAFAQAVAGDAKEVAPRMSAADRARLRKQRKRERQGRRQGRRFRR